MSIRRRFGGLGLGMGLGGGGGVVIDPDAQTFIDRVLADGGTVEDANFLNSFVLNAKANNYWTDIVAAYSPSWGVKGITTVSDLYSLTGASSDINQVNAAAQPSISLSDLNGKTRLAFDGANDFLESVAFTFNQPESMIIGGFRQRVWNGSTIMDGISANASVTFQNTATPNITVYAGSFVADNGNATINGNFHLRSLFNGVSSAVQIDQTAESTGDAGLNNAGGFTLGVLGGSHVNSSAIDVGMVVLLNSTVDGSYNAKMLAVYNFSKSAYGTA